MRSARWMLIGLIVFGIIAMLGMASVWSSAEAAPLAQTTATPTPEPEYFLGDPFTITADACGKSCYVNRKPDVNAYDELEDKDGDGDADLIVPDGKSIRGHLLTVQTHNIDPSSTYTPVVSIHFGTNTNWFGNDLDMLDYTSNGAPVCNATQEACDALGLPKWTHGSPSSKTGPDHYERFRTYLQFVSGSVTYTLQPIYYGQPDECPQPVPQDLPELASSTLQGDDDVGNHHDLVSGVDYYLYTFNGPWHDGSDDRYDIAISWDGGSTWQTLGEAMQDLPQVEDACEMLEPGIKITADEDHNSLDVRVNDIDGEFGDNSQSIDYSLRSGATGGSPTGCGANYTTGQLLEHGTMDADHELGQLLLTQFSNEDVIKIRIPHTYQTTQYDPIKYSANADMRESGTFDWLGLNGEHERVVCAEYHVDDVYTSEGWADFYFQAPYETTDYYIRPWAFFNQYSNNSGTFEYYLFASEYNPPSTACESNFRVDEFIEGVQFLSDKSKGIEIPLTDQLVGGFIPGNWYKISEGVYNGPWSDGGQDAYHFDISTDREWWQSMEQYADCTVKLDNNFNSYYFQAEQPYYYVSAADRDANFGNNTGYVNFTIQGATDLRTERDPIDNNCPTWTTDLSVYEGNFSSQSGQGSSIPTTLTEGEYYALEILDPLWQSGGVDQDTAMIGITQPGSPTPFTELSAWDGTLCYEGNAQGNMRIYFKAQDADYELLADEDENDNVGQVNYRISDAHRGEDPPDSSCEVNYNSTQFKKMSVYRSDVPAQFPFGVFVRQQPLNPGTYVIQTSGTYVDGTSPPLTEMDVSLDNGQTWTDLTDPGFADCVVELPSANPVNPPNHRVYFEITEGDGIMKISTSKETDSRLVDALNDGGVMNYTLKTTADPLPNDDDDDDGDPGDIYDPTAGCQGVCLSPSGRQIVNLAEWMVYVKCRIQAWLSWCNYHTAMLAGLRGIVEQREPFSAISDFYDAMDFVRVEVEGYGWVPEGGGNAEVEQPDNFIFAPPEGGGANIPVVGDDTIWGGGDIDILGDGPAISRDCQNRLATSLGTGLAGPMCFGFNALEAMGLKTWFQVMWDLAMVVAIGMYFNNRWIKPMQS